MPCNTMPVACLLFKPYHSLKPLTCLQRAPDKAESVELPQRRLSPLRPADSSAPMNEALRVGGGIPDSP